ncbi:MAG: YheT family hydrolase [Gammaproteobacteria bacterium]
MMAGDQHGDGDLEPFRPPRVIAGPHRQSVATRLPLLRPLAEKRAEELVATSTDVILDCGDGVRLHGLYAQGHNGDNRRLAVLIHGWEGSTESLYVLSAGSRLQRMGYDVFRLNLRDHGQSHHLNKELFHSNRIKEVVGAIRRIQEIYKPEHYFLGGFSLGGNFSLRVAIRAPDAGINLRKVVAVCPVLEPASTMEALELGWFGFRQYFVRKWKRSLLAKEACFPARYDFSGLDELKTLTQITEAFVEEHAGYPDMHTYLKDYAITDHVMADLQVPSHIIFAADDPVIPVRDLRRLARSPALDITLTAHGGHCGFVEDLTLNNWVDRQIGYLFERALEE